MFPIIVPLMRGSDGDPIERCGKCGEPINRTGKMLDRHPVIITIVGLLTTLYLIILVTRWVDPYNNNTGPTLFQMIGSDAHYFWHLLHRIW